MSLWTPGGEVPINRDSSGAGSAPTPEPAPGPSGEPLSDDQLRALGLDPSQLTDEQRAQAEVVVAQLAESQARIAATPAGDVIANHAMGLYELAAIKLTASEQPQLGDARLAIEALRGLLEAVGDQLGDASEPLHQALEAVQMAFVEASGSAG